MRGGVEESVRSCEDMIGLEQVKHPPAAKRVFLSEEKQDKARDRGTLGQSYSGQNLRPRDTANSRQVGTRSRYFSIRDKYFEFQPPAKRARMGNGSSNSHMPGFQIATGVNVNG